MATGLTPTTVKLLVRCGRSDQRVSARSENFSNSEILPEQSVL